MIETEKGAEEPWSTTHTAHSELLQNKSETFWQESSHVPSAVKYNLTICDAPKFIWFRNAKVGTRTLFSALREAGIELAAESLYSSYYFPHEYRDYFKFAFVRNPWDRFISGWLDKVVTHNHFRFDAHTRKHLQIFDNFVSFCTSKDLKTWDSHFRHQTKLVDINEVDFLGRHENFEQDMEEIFNTLGIPVQDVPAENASSDRLHYSTYYTEKSRSMIGHMYRKDIQVFGYQFEEKGALNTKRDPMSVNKRTQDLLKTAQAEKDYDRSIELLDEVLAKTPDAIEEKITQTHLRALKGQLGLTGYRECIAEIFKQLQDAPLPSIAAGRKILRGIQYSCSGAVRIQFIEALLSSTSLAIGGTTKDALDFLVLQANIYLALGDHSKFLGTVKQFSRTGRSPNKLRPLKRIANKCRSPGFPDYGAEKVFGIGLSRTATSSLNLALRKLGYDSIHWLNPNTQTVISAQDFVLFDGFTDIPVSYQFEELYNTFPNSKFIYTTRPRDSWVGSVSSHYKNARGINMPKELSQPDIAQRFNGMAQAAEWNLYARFETWDVAFDHFQDRVSRFFSEKNSERFLELKITEGEGWEKLCAFLGRDIPDVPFPNVNKRAGRSKNAVTSD